MRYSNELSDLVAKHLLGQAKPSVITEFNKLIVKMERMNLRSEALWISLKK
jgi:hypothetical protein